MEPVTLPSPGDRMLDWESDPIEVVSVQGEEGNETITVRYEDGVELTFWWVNDGDFSYVTEESK